jgi:diguanylate cyclase (GGDEF)-like protein
VEKRKLIELLKDEQFSSLEKIRIDSEIKDELIEHLYKAARPGTFGAFVAASLFFGLFKNEYNFPFILTWFLGFALTLLLMFALDFFHTKAKAKFSTSAWNFALSVLTVIITVFWGSSVLFNPETITQQFILLAFLFMAAGSLSVVTVGMFPLCIVSVGCILLPVSTWLLLNKDAYYNLAGAAIFVYMYFLLVMNYRSTKWLSHSLKLSKLLSSTTHQANHDLLTDLPNQRMLAQYIEQSIETVKLSNENFALISFGINRLEIFNNSLGYHAGDLVIHSIAKRLESQIAELNKLDKKQLIITRPRPDAFVILIVPIKIEDIDQAVNQLFLALNKPFHVGNKESRLTGSAGVTIFPQDSKDPEKLLSNTYAAMFEAKAIGGNQIAFYKATMTSNTPHLLELENDLHNALLKKEFLVYYQPLVDLKTQTICGAEALIRWNHPKRGFVSPIDFIAIAEETGLIIPIGEWVLNEALFQTIAWHQKGFTEFKIAVNLAPKQIRQGNLIETIDNAVKRTGADPHCLELELTETALLDESLSELINQISDRGISLSIDDFGTGYSGLSYLKHFHIDKIKIDKSFIDDVVNSNDSAAIVTATLAMAKELGIKTLAEGVETREQLAFLQERGCQYIQGYYFSKPLSAKDLELLLQEGISSKF